ncbi:5'/3'-nucleotidase SurE [Gordonia sp. NB41Y]|uniref:5'/3'-nucleotidase SurE n=1 Tax=Gordonia sp. NB41Y TaxID=875808 RepID=UPI0009E7945A|nr:5'/3'-nucleotidase SurE [Gordonia sp. NB41Y]WLP88525.1 5'/3'-nucleotidase SurE [Gordonia sp. NB41Y]
MRVLVTNDDGYDADGLIAVASALLAAGHDVVVGAPSSERSGSGSSLGTIEDGAQIPMTEHRLPQLGDTPVFALDCPPALATVAFCAGAFGPRPEFVVSGINVGHNTGRSILFSSTVGAVLAARVAGVGGLAISCGFAPHHRHDTAAAVAERLVGWMDEARATRMTLNVNVPDIDFDDLRGIRVTSLAGKSMFTLRLSRNEHGLLINRDERQAGFREGTDSAAVADGYVSVSALRGVDADPDVFTGTSADGHPTVPLTDALGLARQR